MATSTLEVVEDALFPGGMTNLRDRIYEAQHAAQSQYRRYCQRVPENPRSRGSDDCSQTTQPEKEEAIDFGTYVPRRGQALIGAFEEKLNSDIQEIREEGGNLPPELVLRTTRCIAKQLVPHLALAQSLKWAPFVEDGGGIALVMQSLTTDRRVSIRVYPPGDRIEAIKIDEEMNAEQSAGAAGDQRFARSLATWIAKRG